jgi:hypothetical protein
MTTRCRPHRPGALPASLDRPQLAHLLEGLVSAFADPTGPRGNELPLAVAVIGADPVDAEVDLILLDGPDPAADLFGLVAPTSWTAFGVVASGRVRSHGVEPSEVLVGTLVSRRGQQVTLTRGWGDSTDRPLEDALAGALEGEGPPSRLVDTNADEPSGRIPDACRRVLGLPTAPPQSGLLELWATLWLEGLLASLLAEPRACSWAEAVGRFPIGVGGRPAPSDDDASVTRRLLDAADVVDAWTWDELRQIHARGTIAALGIDPDQAAWMDDGMFSREVLGGLPLLGELATELTALVDARVLALVHRALLAWGLA